MKPNDLEFFTSWRETRKNGLIKYIILSTEKYYLPLTISTAVSANTFMENENFSLIHAITYSFIIALIVNLLVIISEWNYKEYKYRSYK